MTFPTQGRLIGKCCLHKPEKQASEKKASPVDTYTKYGLY